MALFHYQVLTAAGEPQAGQLEAGSLEEAVARLQDQGHVVLKAVPADSAPARGALGRLFERRALSGDEILRFTEQLAVLLSAGQPLDRALGILLDLPESERARRVIEKIREAVRGGASLSEALERQHGVFSRLYVNMVRAGEVGGALDQTLRKLAAYLERQAELKQQVISASIYPAILLVLVFAAVGVLVGYVVPRFIPIFQGMGQELPFVTRLVLGFGLFVQRWWWLGLLAVGAAFYLLSRSLRDPERRLAFDTWLLARGRLGALIARLETARLAHTLGTLIHSGVPLLAALSVAKNVTRNSALAEAIGKAAAEVKEGASLSWALARSQRFPRLAVQMIQVGEESGDLAPMLERLADTFEQQTRTEIDRLIAALVPALTVVMTLIVALIMMAILIPILNLSATFG
ncbi:MAG: type II secretion system protein F [Lysobacterales bacterium]|nr:MAG: type II secretion system protein F [Xanthomonadales bacterium]